MYKAIHDPKRIASAQKSFLRRIRKELPQKFQNLYVGYRGGYERLEVCTNNTIWFAYQSPENRGSSRHWNVFGAGLPDLTHSNNITVEINFDLQGTNRQVAGLFALDEKTGNTILLHRGKIGGGKKGIGKSAFMNWYAPERKVRFIDTSRDSDEETAIFVADLESSNFLSDIEVFVDAVHRFKASLDDPRRLSNSEVRDKAATARATPKSSRTAGVVVYSRNPYVAEYAKRRARGKCELCKRSAPFTNASNDPYLESHHIVWLAHGGADCPENTVALCPNCHRKMHVVKEEKDIEELQRCAKVVLRD